MELFQVAKKAADTAAADGASTNSPEVSRCVDALKQLKRFPVSKDALIATQVIDLDRFFKWLVARVYLHLQFQYT